MHLRQMRGLWYLWPMVLAYGMTARVAGGESVALSELIDRRIEGRLESERLPPAAVADDAEFLRRVFLDLHGVVPTAKQAAEFLESADPEKRNRLIEELLASPRFGQHFADLWGGRLLSPQLNDLRKRDGFAHWLADRFNHDRWDRIVGDLLTATGKIEENPAVTYLIEGNFPLGVMDLTDLSSRYFLGVRLNCAQCHDHPFVEWKQQDYWGMAAFFAEIQTPGKPKAVYKAGLLDNPKMTLASLGDADMLEGYQSRPPTFLGEEELQPQPGQTHRAALADWITSPKNPYFARATANRLWSHFFGRGIVNPVDDMHTGNPPSHPELLEVLSSRFVESGFDLKFLCRAIVSSRAYQRTSRPGEQADAEAKLFARMSIKVLSGEQLYDSLVSILGPPAKARGIDARPSARYEFCQFFAADAEPTRYERGIPHVLRLMNSSQFAGNNLTALASRVASPDRPGNEGVEELFLTILARRPTSAELNLAQQHLREAESSSQSACRELAWALLMSSEFTLNH
jgi:hypothetical protein